MNPEEFLEQQLESEHELISYNQLNELGNKAVQMGLILGHGYRGGKYEILCKKEVLLFSTNEAQTYLQKLIDSYAYTPTPE